MFILTHTKESAMAKELGSLNQDCGVVAISTIETPTPTFLNFAIPTPTPPL